MTLLKKDVIISPVECMLTVSLSNLLWQTAAHRLVNEQVQSVDDPIGWAAFHANAQQPRDFDVTITPLLPLFPDDSKYVATIHHSMDVVQRAVHRLNPGQVPVLTLEQPLFTIAQQIQWHWPYVYGEDKFVILLGGLHIEMATLTTPGYFLDGSGWTHTHPRRFGYSRKSRLIPQDVACKENKTSSPSYRQCIVDTHAQRLRHILCL